MSLNGSGSAVDQLLQLAEEQRQLSRGSTTFEEQRRRRRDIFRIKDSLKDIVNPSDTDLDCLNFIENVLKLENFMLAVPEGVQVVPSEKIKQTGYVNGGGSEVRMYFAPHIGVYDNDSISVAFAWTPAHYSQPLHAHFQTKEYTLSLGQSVMARFQKGLNAADVLVPKFHFGVSDRGLAHAIVNYASHWAPNISVKIPQALGDRYRIDPACFCSEEPASVNVLSPSISESAQGFIYSQEAEDCGYSYRVEVTEFLPAGSPLVVEPKNEWDVYFVAEGKFGVQENGKRQIANRHSLIVVDPKHYATVSLAASARSGALYRVKLLEEPLKRRANHID